MKTLKVILSLLVICQLQMWLLGMVSSGQFVGYVGMAAFCFAWAEMLLRVKARREKIQRKTPSGLHTL